MDSNSSTSALVEHGSWSPTMFRAFLNAFDFGLRALRIRNEREFKASPLDIELAEDEDGFLAVISASLVFAFVVGATKI